MLDTENLFLSFIHDGDSYEARQAIARTFLASGNKAAAMTAMSGLITSMIASRPQNFDATEKQKKVCTLAADRALAHAMERLTEELDYQAKTLKSASLSGPAAGTASSYRSPDIPVRKVDAMVLEVLRKCRVQECMVYLPSGQLERKLYENVNAVLSAMGGKWTGGKTQAHVFRDVEPEAFATCFDDLRVTGCYSDPKDLGFFETSPELATQVVKIAGLKSWMRVLEPSAGRGRIALAAAQVVGNENVTCIEIFAPNVRALQQRGLQVLQQDFLSEEPPSEEADKYDVVVMNPPFGKMQDIAHVTHACQFLKRTGRLVAITSPSWEGRTNHQKSESFRQLLADSQADVINVEAGAFKAAGTMVATRIIALDAENLPWNQCETLVETSREAPTA